MPEEIRVFIRSFLFALVIGAIYWIVSYDYIGTVLLGAFSLASFVAAALLHSGEPRRDRELTGRADAKAGLVGRVLDFIGTAERPGEERPFEDEEGRIPVASVAPILIGIGIALVGLGLVFGLWLAIAGAIPALLGFREWLREVTAELRALAAADDDAPTHAGGAPTHGADAAAVASPPSD